MGEVARRAMHSLGVAECPDRVESTAVYLIEGDLDEAVVERLGRELLADPVTETSTVGSTPARAEALIEVHPLPGVMDPDAEAVELAIRTMLDCDVSVRTGRRFDLHGTSPAAARGIAERCLANPVIHDIHEAPYCPDAFPTGSTWTGAPRTVPIAGLDDQALLKLSREAHLFLSLEEMRAIQSAYEAEGREPWEIELETLAQTWSEHCVHKTLKATIRCSGDVPGGTDRPGFEMQADGTVVVHNLLKSTIAHATHALMQDGIDWCLSVFVDNAGIIAFDDDHAVCFKCETHNHPSAIEPYGGAATGIGGCIRDIIGTGLAARPIAATDIFCVAPPDQWTRDDASGDLKRVPDGCLHPRRILSEVVRGVRDYGNRMGIPTLNGAVWFHDDYIGNPLVYCGCIGVMPRSAVSGDPQVGDRIIALGGRTGRDGIHGATFSSAELTDAHADEFAHAVQIGNPVTEKKTLDAILRARDYADGCLFNAITDCGAGGFSSAVGEMGETLGAEVHLEGAPLKYAGLSPTEIWISEAQERMVLAVAPDRIPALQSICDEHDVELADLGSFGTPDRNLVLHHEGEELGRLSMAFLHDGLPETLREATLRIRDVAGEATSTIDDVGATLLELLAHPNIASKRWIIRQYDHEVQGGSVVLPLVGAAGEGPGDAAVVRPVADSPQGLAIGCGLAPGLGADCYRMALAGIDECVRNLVCVGTDPERIAILDNFCWPGCDDPALLGDLVLACVGCHDGAMAYRTPFISGKDSLNNQFTPVGGETIRIPATLLISGFGIVPDAEQSLTMDAKAAGSKLVLVGRTGGATGGSHLEMLGRAAGGALPDVDLDLGPRTARCVAQLISAGRVRAAHDCSDGGILVAAAEMAMAGELGLALDGAIDALPGDPGDARAALFSEEPSRYLLEVDAAEAERLVSDVESALGTGTAAVLGSFDATGRVTAPAFGLDVEVRALMRAWTGTLDW